MTELAAPLKEPYGKSRFLLQNKLLSIDKIGDISQFRNNLSHMLTSLVNVMNDLSTLAKNHDLEGQLYKGAGLEKVISLLGEACHKTLQIRKPLG